MQDQKKREKEKTEIRRRRIVMKVIICYYKINIYTYIYNKSTLKIINFLISIIPSSGSSDDSSASSDKRPRKKNREGNYLLY